MVGATKISNPLFLTRKADAESITMLHLLADKLMHFGYNYFIEEFIVQLKKKLPNITEEANKEHDLDIIKP